MAIIKIYEEFVDNELKSTFEALKNKWIEEVGCQSNPRNLYKNKFYQAIISMGKKVIPILIEDFKSPQGDWFQALYEITGVNPIREGNGGYVPKMIEDWENWYKNSYV